MTDTPRLVRLVDDDEDLRLAQVQTLRIAGFAVEPFASAAEALEGMTADYPGAVLSDVRMPGMDGLELFDRLHGIDPELPVILLTGHADVPMAVSALKQGAYDFLSKPIGADALLAAVGRIGLGEALEDARAEGFRYAASAILHPDLEPFAAASQVDRHASAGGGMLDRVGQ